MPQKITRRQILKLLALTAASTAVATLRLNAGLQVIARTAGDYDLYLPIVMDGDEPTPTPTPTLTPTPACDIFSDGYGGDVDTGTDLLMSSNWATRNGGQHASFQLEGLPGTIQHALLKFDLSPLPKSYHCIDAKLYLYHDYSPEGSGLNTGKVYSVTAANWLWIEGSGDIDIAKQGEPCWNAREADGSGGVQTPWAGSAGCSTAGIDYDAAPIGSWSFDADSPLGTEVVIDLDTSVVEAWFGSPNSNYGIILIADDNIHSAHVGSAENANPDYRPKMVVRYCD